MRILIGVLTLAFLSSSLLLGGDDPKKDPPPDKGTHKLPTNYSKLGLSADQKKKIFAIEDEYDPKIAALKKQIEDLTQEKRTKVHDVLTDEQKKRLKEIRDSADGEKPKDDKPKDDKPKDDKPKDDKTE
jgi:hypothetical protein